MLKEEIYEKEVKTERYTLKIKSRIGPHFYGEAYWKDTMKFAGFWSLTAREGLNELIEKMDLYDPIRRGVSE